MIANFVTRWLARRLMAGLVKRTVTSRPADFVIGGIDNPYMYRWWIIPRNSVFNVYLHRVVRDDDDRALHDHPFASVSLCLDGRLGEVYAKDVDGLGVPTEVDRFVHPGDVVWRGARFAHRLFLPRSTTDSGEAWTLFITGPRIREWGFWCPKETKVYDGDGVLLTLEGRRWVHWKQFTAPNDSSKIGRGCE
jgi:hypothetical protein